MTLIEQIKFDLSAIRRFGPADWEDAFKQDLYAMDRENNQEADLFLIENAAELDSYEMSSGATLDSSWRFRYPAIAHGDYPLEKLPPM